MSTLAGDPVLVPTRPSFAAQPRRKAASTALRGATPPELWDLLVGLPPPDLYRPQRLDPILRRIEQW